MMQTITGKKYLTFQVVSDGAYMIEYSDEQYVDILNNTNGDIKVSGEEIGDDGDNYIVMPPNSAYNDMRLYSGKLYIIAAETGHISLAAR